MPARPPGPTVTVQLDTTDGPGRRLARPSPLAATVMVYSLINVAGPSGVSSAAATAGTARPRAMRRAQPLPVTVLFAVTGVLPLNVRTVISPVNGPALQRPLQRAQLRARGAQCHGPRLVRRELEILPRGGPTPAHLQRQRHPRPSGADAGTWTLTPVRSDCRLAVVRLNAAADRRRTSSCCHRWEIRSFRAHRDQRPDAGRDSAISVSVRVSPTHSSASRSAVAGTFHPVGDRGSWSRDMERAAGRARCVVTGIRRRGGGIWRLG